MLTLILTAGLICTTQGNVTTCQEASSGEIRALQEQMKEAALENAIASRTRLCIRLKRKPFEEVPLKVELECELESRLLLNKAMRAADQNGVQR